MPKIELTAAEKLAKKERKAKYMMILPTENKREFFDQK